ncbi:MAG TPA: GNAT family N-acetyltransferase, partial [Thermoguttaceae bacterium]|nr:GNAT family N-acetyltransferase [Thermoguttaceae bacterium]
VQAEAVEAALRQLGHEPISLECTLRLDELKDRLSSLRPEVVFNLVESLGGSDWLAHAAAGLFDVLQIPYTGSRSEALMISNDKLLTKRLLRLAGLPTPDWIVPTSGQLFSGGEDTLGRTPAEGGSFLHPTTVWTTERESVLPHQAGRSETTPSEGLFLIKMVREHASIGLDDGAVVQVQSAAQLQSALSEAAHRLGRPVFAERFVEGREFNLSVLAGPNGPEVLPPAEIDFSAFPPEKVRIVGYAAKWEEGSFEYHHTPRRFDFPPSDAPLLERLKQLALACWELFHLGGYARVDFRVDPAGQPWILEINTNPCLAPDAGFAAAVAEAGLTYAQAIDRIVQDALHRHRKMQPTPSDAAGSQAPAPDRETSLLPPGYQFRDQPRPEDRQAVREIVRSTGFFNPAEIEVADELVRERLQAGPASGYYFLFLEHQGQVIGYGCYGPIAATAGSFDLYWIAVHRQRQGRGLGRAILQECERRIQQAGGQRIYIETSGRAQYEPTRQFYQRCGYQCEARLKDFYAPGDDKLIYVKLLGTQ